GQLGLPDQLVTDDLDLLSARSLERHRTRSIEAGPVEAGRNRSELLEHGQRRDPIALGIGECIDQRLELQQSRVEAGPHALAGGLVDAELAAVGPRTRPASRLVVE